MNWDIFCNVVDNYGDIGVAWRLARQLAAEHGLRVRLWVDDVASFARIQPGADGAAERQRIAGVEVRHWREPFADTAPAEAVIEAFACGLPPAYLDAMARRPRKPAWINLEYLSAEDWVAGCHGMASPHPRLPLVCHFFFPGFAPGTGGLLREAGLLDERRAFCADGAARAGFRRARGLPPPRPHECVVTLFGYRNAGLASLLQAWETGGVPVLCLVPQGEVARAALAFCGAAEVCGEKGRLRVRALPFTDQAEFDRLLWFSDINFVRGEDSFVRAQWAAHPFVWQIYPQEEGAHMEKLAAFLAHYRAGLAVSAASALENLWLAWNRQADPGAAWAEFLRCRDALAAHAARWAENLAKERDLAANLVNFVKKVLE
jgi:uncharacterized repeat protein (TIGR03837 family)